MRKAKRMNVQLIILAHYIQQSECEFASNTSSRQQFRTSYRHKPEIS